MATIKPLSDISAKYARVTPQRSEDYEKGITNPKTDWEAATAAAEPAYKDAVTKAANEGRFGRGVHAAGTAKWKARAKAVGPARFAEGVANAGPDYQKGFAPYHEVISATVLPPRYAKGDVRNIQRVAVLCAACHAKKVGK